jgi:hypothetical protein
MHHTLKNRIRFLNDTFQHLPISDTNQIFYIIISMLFPLATLSVDASALHIVTVIYFSAVSIGIICFWFYSLILFTVLIIEPVNTGLWRYVNTGLLRYLRQPRRNLIDSSFDLVRSIEQNQLQKAAGG